MYLAVGNLNGNTLTVTNVVGFFTPFDVQPTYADGSTETVHQRAAEWEKNGQLATVQLKGTKKIVSLKLAGVSGWMPRWRIIAGRG